MCHHYLEGDMFATQALACDLVPLFRGRLPSVSGCHAVSEANKVGLGSYTLLKEFMSRRLAHNY